MKLANFSLAVALCTQFNQRVKADGRLGEAIVQEIRQKRVWRPELVNYMVNAGTRAQTTDMLESQMKFLAKPGKFTERDARKLATQKDALVILAAEDNTVLLSALGLETVIPEFIEVTYRTKNIAAELREKGGHRLAEFVLGT